MGPWGKSAKSYWQNELNNMLGIQQGNITPTELPEFKGMESMWKTGSNDQMQNLVRMLSQSGVQGGKANQAINAVGQGNENGLLKLIQNIYGQANQRGAQAANTGLDWQKYMTNLWANQHAQGQQMDMAKKAQLFNYLKTGMAMAAAPFTGGTSMAAAGGGVGDVGGLAGSGGMTDWYMKNLYGK
jgi:hypothetical protein